MIDAFCEENLDGDYQYLCIHALQKLCRKKDSPMYKGRDNTWAAGIVYAIAQVTELAGNQRDLLRWRLKNEISAAQVAAAFGVSSGAMQGKAKEIREVLNITKQQEEWMTPEWRDNIIVERGAGKSQIASLLLCAHMNIGYEERQLMILERGHEYDAFFMP